MIESDNLRLGQMVRSKAGRDKGWVFFIVAIIDKHNVLVADGDYRKMENPKRKRVKHLQPYNEVNVIIANKLESNSKIENIELQRELERSGAIELAIT